MSQQSTHVTTVPADGPPWRPGESGLLVPGNWAGLVAVGVSLPINHNIDDWFAVYLDENYSCWQESAAGKWRQLKIRQVRINGTLRRYVNLRGIRGTTSAPFARLVCLGTYGLPPSERSQAGHRNEDSLHDDPANLIWLEPEENMRANRRYLASLGRKMRDMAPETVERARRQYRLEGWTVAQVQLDVIERYRDFARSRLGDPLHGAWAAQNLEFTISDPSIRRMLKGETYKDVPMPPRDDR